MPDPRTPPLITVSKRRCPMIRNITASAPALIVCLAIPFIAAAIGGFFTGPAIPVWYANLVKPSFIPPSWLFGPVWTALYAMMGVALFLIWKEGPARPGVRMALLLFAGQLALNAAWSVLFFGLRSPGIAFADIIALWLLVLATLAAFMRISGPAGALLIPYLAWVSFAAVLNFSIWRLNP